MRIRIHLAAALAGLALLGTQALAAQRPTMPPGFASLSPREIVEHLLARQSELALSEEQIVRLLAIREELGAELERWIYQPEPFPTMLRAPMTSAEEVFNRAAAVLTDRQLAELPALFPRVAGAERVDPLTHRPPVPPPASPAIPGRESDRNPLTHQRVIPPAEALEAAPSAPVPETGLNPLTHQPALKPPVPEALPGQEADRNPLTHQPAHPPEVAPAAEGKESERDPLTHRVTARAAPGSLQPVAREFAREAWNPLTNQVDVPGPHPEAIPGQESAREPLTNRLLRPPELAQSTPSAPVNPLTHRPW